MFARMILDDPELEGIAAVIFDEFHERSLDADFGLALALDVQAGLRDDLRLLVMSATLDVAAHRRLMGDAPVIESDGPQLSRSTSATRTATPSQRIEDVDGAGDRRGASRRDRARSSPSCRARRKSCRTAERLEGRFGPDTIVAPLYGNLGQNEQDQAIRPAPQGKRKIVLATSIAETSITIDGVRIVIDSGLQRLPVFEPATGITRLETRRVSRASADQRAGRAGRTEPGIAIRLWHAGQTAALGLHPAGDPGERSFRPGARSRPLGRARSRTSFPSSTSRRPRHCRGAGAARLARRARCGGPTLQQGQEDARAGAAAAAGGDGDCRGRRRSRA